MKGFILIYQSLILLIGTTILILNYEKINQGILQIKYYLYNQRKISKDNQEFLKQLVNHNLENKTSIFTTENYNLYFINNGFVKDNTEQIFSDNVFHQNVLINYEYYTRHKTICNKAGSVKTDQNWSLINPKSCLDLLAIKSGTNFINYNYIGDFLSLGGDTVLLINGILAMNKLEIKQKVTIITLGEIIIDDLIFLEPANLTLISLKGSILVRHLPENIFINNKQNSKWQIGNFYYHQNNRLDFLNSIAIGIFPNHS